MTNESDHNPSGDNSLDDTTQTDFMIQGAFDRLRADAGKVNAMTALHAHEDKNSTPWYVGAGALVVGFAAIWILIVVAVLPLLNDASVVESDTPVADGAATPEPAPDDGAAPATTDPEAPVEDDDSDDLDGDDGEDAEDGVDADQPDPADATEDVQVSTSSSFDDLPGCGTTETNATGASVTTGDLVDIESFDNGSCRRTVFTFADGTAFNPDVVSIAPSRAGGVNINYPSEFDVQPSVLEDRSVGLATQALYWDGGYYLHVNHGQVSELTNVTVLASPTRIIVDTPTVNAASDPLFGTDVILPGDLGEVSLPLTVNGYVAPGENGPEGNYFVEVRQAGQPVTADWSGIEAIGDPELTDTRYAYTVNPAGWFEFSVTVDGLPAGDYELVFLESNETEIALAAPFTVAGQTDDQGGFQEFETATIASLPANFVPVLDELRLMTSVPIMLPTEFDEPTENLFLTIVSAEDDRYEVVIGLSPDCFGGNACQLGTVSTIPVEEGLSDVSGELVQLADGRFAQFFPATCGATCSDGVVVLQDDLFQYDIGLKAADVEAATDFASSARIIN